MKTATHFLSSHESNWLHLVRSIEDKLVQTIDNFSYSPAADPGINGKSAGFWDLLNEGIIAMEDQNHEELQSFSELKNMESSLLKQRIDSYCITNSINEIPAIAKLKAIRFLEVKFRQISHSTLR